MTIASGDFWRLFSVILLQPGKYRKKHYNMYKSARQRD